MKPSLSAKANAIIYARFSPRPNADQSESIKKQIEVCREYCRKKQYAVLEHFEDRALSGTDADRPGLWAAIDAVKRGYVLVVRWRSRLARDVYLEETIERLVDKAGGHIEAVEENNGQKPHDKMIRQILAAFREYERRMIAMRTKYAMLKYQNKDKRIMSKKLPYGYKRDPHNKDKMIEEPREQIAIDIMERLREKGISYRGIAKELDRLNYPPRNGGKWSHRTVSAVLKRTNRDKDQTEPQ